MTPLISIIIPAREEEHYIEATVRQFENLKTPHEVIVCDAKSTDATAERARAAGAVVVIDESGIRRAAQQRNEGARHARGSYLLFIDVTVTLPGIDTFVERALSYFSNEAFVGVGGAQWIDPKTETWTDRIMLFLTNRSLQYQNNVLKRGICSGKFQLIRRSAFEQLGGFNTALVTGEDHDMFERLAKIGKTYIDPKLAYYYAGRREHAWGWWKLLRYWMRDEAALRTTGKSLSDDWAPISK